MEQCQLTPLLCSPLNQQHTQVLLCHSVVSCVPQFPSNDSPIKFLRPNYENNQIFFKQVEQINSQLRCMDTSTRSREPRERTNRGALKWVVVCNEDRSARVCVDHHLLSSVTRKGSYALREIQTLFDCLHGSAFLTSLNLWSGHHQVKVSGEDRDKTAFIVPWGALYAFETRAVLAL